MQLSRLEFPKPFTPNFHIANESRCREYIEMFGDRLPRNVRPRRQLRDGHCPAHTQDGDEPQAHLIAERGEYRRAIVQ
jgi:hypothetical protein